MATSMEDRTAALERELRTVSRRLARVERELALRKEVATGSEPDTSVAPPCSAPPTPRVPLEPASSRSRWVDLEEVLGGRLLSLVGGTAVILGLAFLVALTVERGWIGETTRVVLALLGSAALLAAGAWLYEARGRTQAALAAIGTGIAGLFLVLVAATTLYALVPVAPALAGAAAVGALAATLAVRWESATLAALGILGALISPVLVGTFPSLDGIAFLALALAASAAVLVWRRWEWLRVAAFAVAMVQVAIWSLDLPPAAQVVSVLSIVGGLNLAAAVGYELRIRPSSLRPSTALLVAVNALVVGGLGYVALLETHGVRAAGAWTAALAVVHLAVGLAILWLRTGSQNVGLLLLGVALTAADIAFALFVDGPALAVGWAASAAGLAALTRRYSGGGDLVPLTLGGQLSLAIAHTSSTTHRPAPCSPRPAIRRSPSPRSRR